jgi:hypothetical protein
MNAPTATARRVDIIGPAMLERGLAATLSALAPADLPSVREARQVRASIRGRYGFQATHSPLLTPPTGNEKARKGTGAPVWTLSLAPGASSDVAETCAFRGACSAPCVAHAGNGGFPTSVRGRQARTALLVEYPAHFLALLVAELDRATADSSGRRNTRRVEIRLNTFSDLRWERILPAWFWVRYSRSRFYDYTKHPLRSRPAGTLPGNYSLTYSVSERTTASELAAQRAAGRSVAVVVPVRGGTDRRTGKLRPLPATPPGVPVVDGDANDRRAADPAGALVLLRRKGTLRANDPLVTDSARLAALLS